MAQRAAADDRGITSFHAQPLSPLSKRILPGIVIGFPKSASLSLDRSSDRISRAGLVLDGMSSE